MVNSMSRKNAKFNKKNNSGKTGGFLINKKPSKLFEGVFVGTGKAYNFCFCSDINQEVFVPPKKSKGAINGDRVMVKLSKDAEQRYEAQVVKITKRANERIVGQLIRLKNEFFVKPDNLKISKYIKIEKRFLFGASVGQKVVCKLIYQPENEKDRFLGEICEILGENESEEVLELAIMRERHIYEAYPADVVEECDNINKKGISENDLKNRVDLTESEIFTIDGADAKDLDDAISLEILENGNYYLGVHIADVGNYVKRGSKTDNEAFLRGTSVYFPTMTFAMLPKTLSNGICSLFENELRLTLSVFMEINSKGDVVNHKICESYIKSKARLTYDDVYAVITGQGGSEKAKQFENTFLKMNELAKLLQNKRENAGSLDFEIAEPYFEIDENNQVVAIKKRDRNDAHKLIESFMVVCNETVAKEFCSLQKPFAYRVHETPTLEKLNSLKDFLAGIGIDCPPVPSKITPQYYGEILSLFKDSVIKESLNKMVLRSLQKAKYSTECLGHFGLALDFYCHFTSPIRRYPDLLIHRIIKDHLNGKKEKPDLEDFVFEACEQSSLKERSADEAEREVDDLKKAQFMKKFVGEEFEGVISSVNSFGFFVELENTVEGLVRVESLPDDHYLFFEKSLKLKGQKRTFSIGDKVKVILANVDIYQRKIDFSLKID